MTVAEKILAVMADVESVKKDKRNDFHKYNYASDEAIVEAIREALIKHKLVITPSQKSCTQVGDVTTVEVEYELEDVDSKEKKLKSVFGQGQDKGDKGVYKAATGAEKYFLLKTFLIPTNDDPENEGKAKSQPTKALPIERGSDVIVEAVKEMANDAIEPENATSEAVEVPAKYFPPAEPAHFPKEPAPREKKPGTISDPQRKRFYAIYKKVGKTDAEVKAYLLKTIGSEHSADIPWKQYEAICQWADPTLVSR